MRLRRGITGFTQEALVAMLGYSWPGNIRELDNRIQRGVALTNRGDIDYPALFSDFESGARHPIVAAPLPSGGPLHEQLANHQSIKLADVLVDYERGLIEAALNVTGDNLTEAAKLLGLSFRQIRYKVRQLHLR